MKRVIRHSNKIPLISEAKDKSAFYGYESFFMIFANDSAAGLYSVGYSTDGSSWATYSSFTTKFWDGNIYKDKIIISPYVENDNVGLGISNLWSYKWNGTYYTASVPSQFRRTDTRNSTAISTDGTIVISGLKTDSNAATIYSKDNGKSFTYSSTSFYGVAKWVNNQFLGIDRTVAYGTEKYYTSNDGINWIQSGTGSGGPSTIMDVIYDGTNYFVCSEFGSGGTPVSAIETRIAYSSDLLNWSLIQVPTNMNCYGIAYSPSLNRYVVVGTITGSGIPANPLGTASICYSTGGTSWSAANFTTGLNSVIWSNRLNKFLAVGSGYVVESSDGISWSTQSYFGLPGGTNVIKQFEWP